MLNRIRFIVLMLAMLMSGGAVHAGDLEPTMGEDGIYHYDWYHQSFLELEDDITEALDEGKILMVKFDQVGCLYCEKLALETLAEPAINAYVREHFVVVQHKPPHRQRRYLYRSARPCHRGGHRYPSLQPVQEGTPLILK